MIKEETTLEEYIFHLTGYIITCTEEALRDGATLRHSVLRFLEIIKRIIDMTSNYSEISEDEFLFNLREKLTLLPRDKNQMSIMRDEIQKIIMEFAEESIKRM